MIELVNVADIVRAFITRTEAKVTAGYVAFPPSPQRNVGY